ncbi:MAG: primosomal protein N' [Candidatus Saccharimonadales bacterium]
MYYYFVWVRSNRYHGSDPLTYSSEQKLTTGSVVRVELQRQVVMGVVSGVTTEPRFKTKPITEILDIPPIPAPLLKTAQWLQAYYPAPLGIISQQLIPASLTEKRLKDTSPTLFDVPDLSTLPKLTHEQTAALEKMTERDTYLLHGVTGSGKTRVYIELVARAIEDGKSAVVLTPEISLTSQLASNFERIFGNRVIVLHSQQTPAEREKAWLACLRATEPVVVIGPRSALFSPVQKLGIIILDEAHESAYKQEQSPQYQTVRVASYLAGVTRSSLVLGSATPSVSDYYLAERKKKPIIELTTLAAKAVILSEAEGSRTKEQTGSLDSARDDRVTVEIVDKKEFSLFSKSSMLSQPLLDAIKAALSRGEQTLLYLNRRGTARMVMCEHCGWQATCPHCDLPLTYHGDSHELRCHSCSYHTNSPGSCPACKHPTIMFKTAGTKAVAEEVERLFPQAKVARFDTDNTKAERFEQQYQGIRDGKVDILVGTQLLAKGLDLPKLSTLGVILADTSLYMPDFSAQERTFQLINQVLGRVGRGHVAGHAIIQTYHPEHPALKAAIEADYPAFYKAELASREKFLFPPLCYLLKISVRRASLKATAAAAEKLKKDIQEQGYKVRVEGPAPSFYERFQNKYQWQLVVKATERSELLKVIAGLPANCSYDIDPLDLL